MARAAVSRKKPKSKIAHFVVNSALLEELGERLVSRPEIALAELIKNSYDADSSKCTLTLSDEEIIVEDLGHGMTEKEFLGSWMVVSSPKKGQQRYSRRYRRPMAGSKGVGRFSARFLGSVVTLTSVAEQLGGAPRTRLTATFDWDRIARQEGIHKVGIMYEVEAVGPRTPTGTTLRITQLREAAKSVSIPTIKTDILRLTNAAAGLELPDFLKKGAASEDTDNDPGFEVVVAGDESEDEGPVTENVAAEILKAFVGRVRMTVSEDGQLAYQIFWSRGDRSVAKGRFSLSRIATRYTAAKLRPNAGQEVDPRGLPEELAEVEHLPLANGLHSPAFIDIRFFPRRKGTFTGLKVNGTVAQGWVSENANLAIVDNGFAMPAYADRDSDWLGVDASKARNERSWQSILTPEFFPISPEIKRDPALNPMLALPRGTQLIGRIHISTRKRPPESGDTDAWLQPNMDRESLRANGAFHLLWHVSRFAVELIAHFDRQFRLKEAEEEYRAKREQALTALSKTISEVSGAKNIEVSYRRNLVSRLQEAESRIREAEAYTEEIKISLELMSMMGVMAGFMTHEFEKSIGGLRDLIDLLEALPAPTPEVTAAIEKVRSNEANLVNYFEYTRIFTARAREAQPTEFKAKAQVNFALRPLRALMDVHNIEIEIDIDSKMIGPYIPVAAYSGIVVNLVSNAMKALVPRLSKEPRKIRIYAVNDSLRHALVCADNGIGIPEYLRSRIWDPLFTTTADEENPLGSGLGLGLSVVRSVVTKLGGKIELLDAPPPKFVTAFRVTLPLRKR